MNEIDKELQKLNKAIKSTLKNSKINLLHNVYLYNKKKHYQNYNWMVNELKRWNIYIPNDKNYISIWEISLEISKLDKINPSWIEYVLNRLKNNVGKSYFNNKKYKQAKFLYVRWKGYRQSTIVNKFLVIDWIKDIHKEAYEAITFDNKWFERIHLHIDRIHTSVHKLLKHFLNINNISFNDRDNISKLYKKLCQVTIKKNNEMKILAYGEKMLDILNDVRNNESLVHPNFIKIISKDIGIIFLNDLRNLVHKIKKFSIKI